jgi:peptidoglycan DL-endopeptidase CwlO
MQIPSVSNLYSTKLSSVQSRLPMQFTFAQSLAQAVDEQTADSGTPIQSADSPKAQLFTLVPDTHYTLEPDTVAVTETKPADTQLQVPETQSYSTLGETLSAFAKQFVGNPYVWGGEDLVKGADCSGFTQSVFKNFGISLPRTASGQSKVGREIDPADMQPGDLLCFKDPSASKVGHVGLYIGGGKFVHACSTKTGIIISDVSKWTKSLYTVRRMPELEPAVG